MLHDLLVSWFHFVEQWGYLGVFVLMAMESSIFPVPSEIVMPPAAYWASQGKMDYWLVILAGTAGSYFGSIVTYYVSRWLGEPFIKKYGKYFLMPEKKVAMAQAWVAEYGAGGIFFARLLPVIRHLISIPAGIFRMNVGKFSLMTTVGAFIWCWVLSYFGREIIGDQPNLLEDPAALSHVLKDKMKLIILAIVALGAAFALMKYLGSRKKSSN